MHLAYPLFYLKRQKNRIYADRACKKRRYVAQFEIIVYFCNLKTKKQE